MKIKSLNLIVLLLCLFSSIGAWGGEQVTFTATANLESVTSSNNSSGSADGDNCTISWSGLGGESECITLNDEVYWKLNGDASYISLKFAFGKPFVAGDIVTARVTSNGGNSQKTVSFKTKSGATSSEAKVNSNETADITYTLTDADIESDGSIRIYRVKSEARFNSFTVECKRMSYLVRPQIIHNDVVDESFGSVTKDPAGPNHYEGEPVKLTATPADPSTQVFICWKIEDETKWGNEITIDEVNKDYTDGAIKAIFANGAKVNITANNGTVTKEFINSYNLLNPNGTEGKLTPKANPGYKFDHWVKDGANAGSDIPLVISTGVEGATINVEAVFVESVQQKEWVFTDRTEEWKKAPSTLSEGGISISSEYGYRYGGLHFRSDNSLNVPVYENQYVVVRATNDNHRAILSLKQNSNELARATEGNNDGFVNVDQTILVRVIENGTLNIEGNSNLVIQSINIYDSKEELLAFNYNGSETVYDFTSYAKGSSQDIQTVFGGKFQGTNGQVYIRTDKVPSYILNAQSNYRSFKINNLAEGQVVKIKWDHDLSGYNNPLQLNSGSISINGVAAAAGTTIDSEVSLLVTKDGDLILDVPARGAIRNIKISSSKVPLDLVQQQTYRPKAADEGDDAYIENLLANNTGLTPTIESSNSYVAATTGSNSATDYFRLKHPGNFNVIAKVQYSNTTLTAELPVQVYANTATYVVNGNTYKLTGSGILETPTVTEVPKITMTYGQEGETPIITEEGGAYQSKIIDANGWSHVFVPEENKTTKIPTMGTAYKFEAKATGKLTVVVRCGANTISLVDATDNSKSTTAKPGAGVQTIEFNLENNHTYYLYSNTKDTPDNTTNDWDILQLRQFTFETTFKFAHKSYIYNQDYKYKDANGDEQTVAWADPSIADIDRVVLTCYGNVTADLDGPKTGRIKNVRAADDSKPMGGAIVVTAYNNFGESDYYVVTVPYEEYEWNFKNNFTGTEAENNKGITFENDANGVKIRDWGVTYEVREYLNNPRRLNYLNEPILAPNVNIAGNNAAYIGQTAGLMFEAAPKQFGLRGSGVNLIDKWKTDNPGETMSDDVKDGLLKQMLAYKPDDIDNTSINCAAFEKGAVLRIPNLKAGSFVAIKFFRHAPGTGDAIKMTNVKDLRDWSSSYWTDHDANNIYWPTVSAKPRKVSPADASVLNVTVGNQTNSKDVYASKYGWLEFQVDKDGDVTLEVTDKGWTHIKKIAISPKFINTDLNLTVNNHTAVTRYKLPGEPGTGSWDIIKYDNNIASVHGEATKSVFYSLENVQTPGGADKITITPDGQLTASHPGTADVVQKVFNNNVNNGDALIDIQKTHIVIVAEGNTQQVYPYTWDFTNISDDTKSKLTSADDWDGNETEGFTPKSTSQGDYLQNSELCYDLSDRSDDNAAADKDSQRDSSKEIKEFNGLGFQTSIDGTTAQTNGLSNMKVKPGTGLEVAPKADFAPVVPDVPADATVYVRTTGGGSVTLVPYTTGGELVEIGTTVTTPTDGTSDKIYSVPGKGGDVVVQVEGTTVKGIGVTNIFKECKFWDNVNDLLEGEHQYCYHSDSHEIDLDYPLTLFYTDIEMKAYVTSSYSDESKVVTLEEVTVVPAYEGLVVRSIDQYVDHPLFKPAINTEVKARTEAPFAGNMMHGFPNGGTASDVNTALKANHDYYGFTNVYQKLDEEQKNLVGNKLEAELPGFYQLFVTGTLGSNRALLALPNTVQAKAFTLRFINKNDEPTSIDIIENTDSAEYYTTTGVKLQNKPTQKGVYIMNGKKVFIK